MSVQPTVQLSLGSADLFPGVSGVTVALTFTNPGTEPGYSPFAAIDLGPNTNGISLNPTFSDGLGGTVTAVKLTTYVSGSGWLVPGTTLGYAPIYVQGGPDDAVYIVQSPFGSFAQNQTALTLTSSLSVADTAPVGVTTNIAAYGGFLNGDVAVGNAPIITSAAVVSPVVTSDINVYATQSGSNTLGGPGNNLTWTVYGNVDENYTVYNLSLTDPLPPEAVASSFVVTDGKGHSWTYSVNGGVLSTNSPGAPAIATAADVTALTAAGTANVYYNTATNALTAYFGQYTGESTSPTATDSNTAPSISATFTLPAPTLGTASSASTGTGDLSVTDELPYGAVANTFAVTQTDPTGTMTGSANFTYDASTGTVTETGATGTLSGIVVGTTAPAAGANTPNVYYDATDGKIVADFGSGLAAGTVGALSAAWANGQPQAPGYVSNTVAANQSLSDYTVYDQLAGGQTVNTVTITNGQGASNTYSIDSNGVLTLVGTAGITGIGIGNGNSGGTGWIYYDTADNRIVTDFGNVSTGSSAESFTVSASNSGSTELNSLTGASTTVNNIPAASGGYSSASGAAAAITQLTGNTPSGSAGENTVTALPVTLTKIGTPDGAVQPGDDITWSVTGTVSDYSDVNNVIVTDTLGNGTLFDASKPVTLTGTSDGKAFSLNFDTTPVNSTTSGSDTVTTYAHFSTDYNASTGVTTITYNVSDALANAGDSATMDGGAGPIDTSVNPVGATFTINYNSTIQTTYANGALVDQGDSVGNDAKMTGNDVGTNAPVSATASAGESIPTGTPVKTIYAINGELLATAVADKDVTLDSNGDPEVKAGDVVTYELSYTLPQTNTTDLSLTDFLPLPIYDVGSGNGTLGALTLESDPGTIAGETTAGVVTILGGTPTGETGTPTLTPNEATNSVTLDLGAFNDGNSYPSTTVNVLLSAEVIDKPFVNGLQLTNELTSTETPSDAAPVTKSAIKQVELVQPVIQTFKSVTGITSSGAKTEALSGITNANTFNSLFSAATGELTGKITDTTVKDLVDNATGAQGGDTVNYAIALQNTGGAAAFNINLADQLPAGITIADVSNITITNGAGVTIPYTGSLSDLFTTGGLTLAPSGGIDPNNTTTPGADIALITYQVTLPADVSLPNLAETNTATVSAFTAEAGPSTPNFANAPGSNLTASATVDTAKPSIVKTVIGTGLDPVGSATAHADTGSLQIGEQVTYQVTTTLDKGTYSDLKLSDVLPSGTDLSNVTYSNLLVGGDITATNAPTLAALASGAADLGLTTVTDNSGGAADQITFDVTGYAIDPTNSNNNGGTASFNNEGKVVATNSVGDSTTETSNVSVTELAPDLTLTKSVEDVTTSSGWSQSDVAVNGGDTVKYELALTDAANTNPAFNVAIADAVNANLAGGVTLNAGSIVVYNADGTENQSLTTTANESSTSVDTTIAEIDAGQTYKIDFTGTVNPKDAYGTAYTNNATFTGSTMAVGTTAGTPQTVSGKSNTVDVTTTLPTSTKALTSVSDTTLNTANGSTGNKIEPGDVGTYTVTVTLPEGTSSDLSLQDILPAGLTYVPGSAAISNTGAGVTTGTLTESALTSGVPAGQTGFKLDLGAVTAGQASTVTITYQATVANTITSAETLTNTISTYTGTTLTNTATANASVVLPTVLITKTAAPDAVDSIKTAAQTGDAGYVTDYTLTVTPTDNVPAYNVNISDLVPSTETIVGPVTVTEMINGVAQTPFTVAPVGNQITVSGLNTSNTNPFVTGDSYVVTYDAAVNNTSTAGAKITNNTTVTEQTAPIGGGTVSNSAHADIIVPAGSLSGTVFYDVNDDGSQDNVGGTDKGISGDTVSLYEVGNATALTSTLTDANGYYSFGGLSQGSYYVKIGQDGYAGYSPNGTSTTALNSVDNGNGQTSPVNVYANQNTPNQNAGLYNLGTIEGTVFHDTDNSGIDKTGGVISGETVELLNAAGTSVLTTTKTDASGNYSFTGLTPAAYEVQIVKTPSQSISVPQFSTSPVASGTYAGDDDNLASQTGMITGGATGIVVYSGQTVTHQDAGITDDGSISGFAFFDGNCNGIYHVGDAGVAGVTVELLDSHGNAVLDANGNAITTLTSDTGAYQFKNVEVGTYTVQFLAPAGTSFSHSELANGMPLIDSDVNKLGVTNSLTVSANENNADANAGLIFNGYFNGQTPIVLTAGQQYASLTGGNVIVGSGGNNNVHTGSPGNNVVALGGDNNVIELGLSSSSEEDIGTSCGTLQAQTQSAANGFLFAGNSGSSYLDGGSGNSYLMGGTGANQVYSGSGNNTIIAGGNGSLITTGGLSTTIYYQVGDGLLTIDNGLRSGKDTLDVFGAAGGTIETVNGIQELDLGNGNIIQFVGPTPFTDGAIDNTNAGPSLNFNAAAIAPVVEELSFNSNDMPVFTTPGGTVPAAPAPVVTPPAPVIIPTLPGPPVLPVATPPAPVVVAPSSVTGATVTETSGGQNLTPDATVTTLNLFGYNNNVTDTHGGLTVTGDDGSSAFDLTGGNNTLVASGYSDTITMGGANNTVSGDIGNSSITLTGNGNVDTYGYGDTITIGDGASSISGVAGSATITVGDQAAPGVNSGTMTLAGSGNVVTTFAASGSWNITAGNGSDTVNVNGGTDTVNLAGWKNDVTVSAGTVNVSGGDQNTYSVLNAQGSFNIADFNASLGDVLDLSALGITAGSVTLAANSTGTEVYATLSTAGHPTLAVANLIGATPSSLVIGHSLIV